ncbi:MAG TPA: hypothetical protein VMU93_07250 [Caulobacteraceae bacterium]|nr:hypothetical protein [Caulobacteraceae bacterium]
MTRRQWKQVVATPFAAWAALALGIGLTCGYALMGASPFKPAIALAIAACQAAVSAIVFMRLDRASALVRFAAVSGVLWLSFLFILSFCDYLSRAYPP